MRYMGLNEIREKYLAFFESKGHLRRESFSLVPDGDKSLLLINSGMAPFKPYFSGDAVPPRNRMTTCQKCMRTTDIERVGRTSRHCTFFEMLGNFSFGDYFKRDAINWAWEFLTKVMELPSELLYVSVYLEDDEAWDIWTKEVGLSPDHIKRLGKEDNFWEIGSGPCGPDSEIFFDRGADKGCGKPDCSVGCDCDRFIEVWNLVFTQFNNDGQGNYTQLKQKNIDTGMGLERLSCVVQGVDNNFEVDTMTNIRRHVSRISNTEYNASEKTDMSLRIITDHVRSTVMMVSDGILPSNEGRGYVLRRLLRRAARHGRLLGVDKPFLVELCGTVINESEAAYPELREKEDYIRKVIETEEERFAQTIDAGLSLLRDELKKLEGKVFPGEPAFKLYDTYGFPVDLTLEILDEQGITLDRERFDELMASQRTRARAARAALGDRGWTSLDLGLDKSIATSFKGYENLKTDSKILALVTDSSDNAVVTVVLDSTPFYAESGGQVSDHGEIRGKTGVMRVTDVKKTNDSKYLHIGEIISGELSKDESVTAEVDVSRRQAIMRAHSTTHLLHKALRETLGTHVEQAGSLVEPDKLRFDFTHFQALSADEVSNINRIVNEKILEGLCVAISEMPVAKAKELGATALFGEKYGDVVRVVRMGDYSMELCGGTHLQNSALAGSFMITGESSIASGVRRIEALTGKAVLEEYKRTEERIESAASALKTTQGELLNRIDSLLSEHKEALRSLGEIKQKASAGKAAEYVKAARDIGGVKLVTLELDGADVSGLRSMGDTMRDLEPKIVAVFAARSEDKVTFLASCGKDAVSKGVRAGDIIKSVTALCGGSGGGKPESAMGGGKDLSKINEVLNMVEDIILKGRDI